MTLDGPIKDLETEMTQPNLISLQRRNEAMHLGVEAMKRLKDMRMSDNNECFNCIKPLPGESR